MQRGSRDERGFTMVEMIITIAIMAILAGIIGGAYSIIKSGNASKSTSRFLGSVGYHAGRKHDQEAEQPICIYLRTAMGYRH